MVFIPPKLPIVPGPVPDAGMLPPMPFEGGMPVGPVKGPLPGPTVLPGPLDRRLNGGMARFPITGRFSRYSKR